MRSSRDTDFGDMSHTELIAGVGSVAGLRRGRTCAAQSSDPASDVTGLRGSFIDGIQMARHLARAAGITVSDD
jgi:hypothetical protein